MPVGPCSNGELGPLSAGLLKVGAMLTSRTKGPFRNPKLAVNTRPILA
jgi:hypothetical protein